MDEPAVTFSKEDHLEAVVKRRIKFVVEKGAMARLFKKHSHQALKRAVRQRIDLQHLKSMKLAKDFDQWHRGIVIDECWVNYTTRSIEQVRWGHFAKLVNIILYELVANNEIMTYEEAEQLRGLLHLPIDQKVLDVVRSLCPGISLPQKLLGMSETDYLTIQRTIREEARKLRIPAIWFEDAYASDLHD